jgi:thiosulfate/3-mercaptopyruvate sulfurtransferase
MMRDMTTHSRRLVVGGWWLVRTQRHLKHFVQIATAVVMLGAPAAAQTPTPLLVDVDWLSQHLSDRNLVVLHVGTRAEYDAGHIPGARLISEDDVSKPHDMARGDLMLEMPAAADLRATLASLGISDNSHIVVYLGKNLGFPSATRIVLTLDYMGLGPQTSLLNGGLAAWLRNGKPVTNDTPRVTPGSLTARDTKPLIVDAEFVKSVASRPNHKLVDARAPVFYQGIEPTFSKSGHIPGAINIPFTDVVDGEQKVDRARLEGLFSRAGVKPTDTVVAYCHIGQQATAVIFAARLLGHPVLLYDGAFQDWASANRGPVEK